MKNKAFAAFRSLTKPRFKILAYHGVSKKSTNMYELGIETFRTQMQILKDSGYNVIKLDDAVENMNNGSLKKKTIVITFDDAYKNLYENAIPVLIEFGFYATIFVPTGWVGKNDIFSDKKIVGKKIMTWNQLKEISKRGFLVGSHSVSHCNLNDLDEISLGNEIDDSYNALIRNIGDHDYFFAYPFGMLNEMVRNAVYESKFKGALCFGSVLSNWAETDRYQLKREKIIASTSNKEFIQKINTEHDLYRSVAAYLKKTIKKPKKRG